MTRQLPQQSFIITQRELSPYPDTYSIEIITEYILGVKLEGEKNLAKS